MLFPQDHIHYNNNPMSTVAF